MSGTGPEGARAQEKDPLVRFLLGCAIVVGGLAALILGGCGFFAWRLMRDETPGRPVEMLLSGDESRYWCFDLRPDDPGIVAAMERLDRINQEARDRALENTPLRGLPIPTRRADVNEALPLTLELALRTEGDGEIPRDVTGWAGRATVSRGGLRLRAGLKVMRWVLTRDPATARVEDVDGVQVTVVREARRRAAFASIGNRILVADGVDRLRGILGASPAALPPRLAGIPELHASIRLDGEDGWAFASDTRVRGPARPLPLLGAVASLDLTPDDALRFRIVVPAADGAALAALTRPEAVAIVRSFLPGASEDAIDLEDGAPILEGGTAWRIDGRISALTSRLAGVLREWPSASRTDPSPEPRSGPRSDTPWEPTRGETPNPAR